MKALIISASSGIGSHLARSWKGLGWEVRGSFRTESPVTKKLEEEGIPLCHCDLMSPESLRQAAAFFSEGDAWNVLALAAGSMEPIGLFEEVNYQEWEAGVRGNLLKPLELLHRLLPTRSRQRATVLFFAGGGTNGATPHYSSYTLSKIALIKMNELLSHELPDVRFVIVGPGWVETKIHQETLEAGQKSGKSLAATLKKMADGDWVPMEKVVECCTYLVTTPCQEVSGRNFSVAHDAWGSPQLEEILKQNEGMYKLRREGNAWVKK